VTVAVVGAGIAGAACARVLRGAGVDVTVLDRGRVPGGRLASRTLAGRRVDLGASYLTARAPGFVAVVDDWLARGLARLWTDAFHVATPDGLGEVKAGPLRYGAAGGLRSLVVDLLTGLDVRQESPVTSVVAGGDGRPAVDGQPYDAVVLALPDPQALPLLDASLPDERSAVEGRAWEPVLALAAGWDERTWDAGFDGCFVTGDGTPLSWVADDGRRRGDGAPVLVAHSTGPYAAAHLADPDAAGPGLLGATRRVLGVEEEPAWTRVQRWTYARPVAPRDEPFHLGPARVGLCGDGWGSPRVETAWLSGTSLGAALVDQLG
jgi:renalase